MIAGVLAAPAEILSVDAIPKLRQWEATGSLVNGIRKGGVSHMVVPEGGMGQLPIRLASKLGAVRTGLRAERMEALPDGRWRVSGGGEVREADRVVLALPAYEAAILLGPVAQQSAEALAAIPYTSVDLWHSRHAPLPALKDSFGFLIHPPEGNGYLGSLVPSWMDPQSAPEGLMQLRSFIGGAFGKPADLEAWEGVYARLKHWIPTLGKSRRRAARACGARHPAPGTGPSGPGEDRRGGPARRCGLAQQRPLRAGRARHPGGSGDLGLLSLLSP